jgi:hypothetical protein
MQFQSAVFFPTNEFGYIFLALLCIYNTGCPNYYLFSTTWEKIMGEIKDAVLNLAIYFKIAVVYIHSLMYKRNEWIRVDLPNRRIFVRNFLF